MIVAVYTDASLANWHRLATCGFVVLINNKIVKHEITIMDNVASTYLAEFTAAINALQYCFLLPGVSRIILHTDCVGIVNCKRNAKRKRKGRLPFIDELLETVWIIRDYGVEIDLVHVMAHGDNKMNNLIDRSCRYFLRLYIKTKRNETNLNIDRFFSHHHILQQQ